MTVETAVPHANISSMDISVGNWRLTHAAFETVDVVEETEILDDHCCTRSQLMVAVAAELFAGNAENVHGRKHRYGWR